MNGDGLVERRPPLGSLASTSYNFSSTNPATAHPGSISGHDVAPLIIGLSPSKVQRKKRQNNKKKILIRRRSYTYMYINNEANEIERG